MSDLDFDELDKAVNSLMGGAPSTAQSQPVATTNTDTNADTPSNTNAAPATPNRSQAPQASPATNRSRGQYMDVVHPAGNMRKASQQSPSRVSRHGVTVAPRDTAQTVDTASDDVAQEDTERLPANEMPKEKTPEQDVMPDPIAFAERENTKQNAAAENEQPVAENTVSTVQPDAQNVTENTDGLQFTSPFLKDAKVEKRPLGAVDSTVNSVGGEEAQPVDKDSAAEEATTAAATLPAELHDEIMQIEADTTKPVTDTSSNTSQSSSPAQPTEPIKSVEKPTESKQTDAQPNVSPTMIPQRPVPAAPAQASDDAHSMFDDQDAPLKQPAKKKSSWPIVIGAVLLLLLGVGGGIAFFLLNHS